MKHSFGIFALSTLFILVPSQWNTASAQTAISFSFTGSGGLNSAGNVLLTGSGTLNPYGPTTISVVVQSSGTNFTVTFANGSTWTAGSTSTTSGNTVTGTATIIGGTGTFAGATGSFNFDLNFTRQAGNTITFTVTGSGTLNGSATLTYTYYFSDLAFAGGYQTTLTLINYGQASVTCTTSFYNDNGQPLTVPFSDVTAASRTDTLAPGASIHDQTNANLSATVSEGWAESICSGPIEASLLYRLYNASGTAVGEASVNAETAPTSKFVTFAQTATGVAYGNPSTTQTATLTITAYNAAGAQLGSATKSLGPLAHGAANIGPLLNLASFTGSIVITSTIPIISLSLNAEAFPVFSSLPPGDLPATPPTGAQTYYFSDLAFAGGYQTTLTYINYGSTAVTCATTFYGDDGNPLQIPFTQGNVSTRTDILQPGASVHDQTVASLTATVTEGWAKASCTGPVQASLLYRLYQSGTPVGEASVNAETSTDTIFVTFAQTATGVAYANPSNISAPISFVVFDSSGNQLAATTITVGPMRHGSANLGPLLQLSGFSGLVQITCPLPIISLSLNAEAFPVFSSLPPGDLPGSTLPVP